MVVLWLLFQYGDKDSINLILQLLFSIIVVLVPKLRPRAGPNNRPYFHLPTKPDDKHFGRKGITFKCLSHRLRRTTTHLTGQGAVSDGFSRRNIQQGQIHASLKFADKICSTDTLTNIVRTLFLQMPHRMTEKIALAHRLEALQTI